MLLEDLIDDVELVVTGLVLVDIVSVVPVLVLIEVLDFVPVTVTGGKVPDGAP